MSRIPAPSLVWFRQDLRLSDNPALLAASKRDAPIAALYILDDDTPGRWRIGGASRWWLNQSLSCLAHDLEEQSVPLILRRGSAATILPRTVAEIGAGVVFCNRVYEPSAIARDRALETELGRSGVRIESFEGALLAEPWSIETVGGGPYKVFTPFWRALRGSVPPARPLPRPKRLNGFKGKASSDRLEGWSLLPVKPDWAGGLRESWTPGEAGGQDRLRAFVDEGLEDYAERRDIPGIDGVSRMSPYLHWGELSPRQIWHAAETREGPAAEPYLRELGWREFSHHLLWQFPALPNEPFQPRFAAFPWQSDKAGLEAWQRGATGYPLIDAGMRELWQTGWMHNRVRMAAASFLVKHLLLPWRWGEAWFWDTLVDADLANNAANWQWVAGCGADAAPYFRIFNPVLQGTRFDRDGAYVRRFVPELARLPDRWLHQPWAAPAAARAEAGLSLGRDYPLPIVDHAIARKRALDAFASIRATI